MAKKARKALARKRKKVRTARPRRQKGFVGTVKSAVETVIASAEDTAKLRKKMGTRGGLSEG
jgi:hypothetical protein